MTVVQSSPRGRILLVFPEARANYGSGDLKRSDLKVERLGAIYPPLGPLYVAGALQQAGFEVRFVDYSVWPYDSADLRRRLEGCDLLGLHTQTHCRDSAARIARDARCIRPEIRVMAGGPDVTLFRHLPQGVDLALPGEVERTVGDAAACLLGTRRGACPGVRAERAENMLPLSRLPGVIFRRPGGELASTDELDVCERLESLPRPARDIVDRRDYSLFGGFRGRTASLITGRGCTGHCRFCARPAYAYHRYRARPVQDVLDEIEAVARAGSRFLYITDDNLLADRQRALALMRGIVQRKIDLYLKIVARVDVADAELYDALHRAGVRFVDFGLESGCQDLLDFYGKGTTVEQGRRAVRLADERGIFVHAHVIIGAPHEEERQVRRTIELVRELPIDTVFFNVLGYRRGSALWGEARQRGLVSDEEEVVLACRERGLGRFSRAELARLHGHAVRSFYLRRAYLQHALLKLARCGDRELAGAVLRIAGHVAFRLAAQGLGQRWSRWASSASGEESTPLHSQLT